MLHQYSRSTTNGGSVRSESMPSSIEASSPMAPLEDYDTPRHYPAQQQQRDSRSRSAQSAAAAADVYAGRLAETSVDMDTSAAAMAELGRMHADPNASTMDAGVAAPVFHSVYLEDNYANFDVPEDRLYEDAYRRELQLKHKRQEQAVLQQLMENEVCTFHPKINRRSASSDRDRGDGHRTLMEQDVFARLQHQQRTKRGTQDYIEQRQMAEEAEMDECSFTPAINRNYEERLNSWIGSSTATERLYGNAMFRQRQQEQQRNEAMASALKPERRREGSVPRVAANYNIEQRDRKARIAALRERAAERETFDFKPQISKAPSSADSSKVEVRMTTAELHRQQANAELLVHVDEEQHAATMAAFADIHRERNAVLLQSSSRPQAQAALSQSFLERQKTDMEQRWARRTEMRLAQDKDDSRVGVDVPPKIAQVRSASAAPAGSEATKRRQKPLWEPIDCQNKDKLDRALKDDLSQGQKALALQIQRNRNRLAAMKAREQRGDEPVVRTTKAVARKASESKLQASKEDVSVEQPPPLPKTKPVKAKTPRDPAGPTMRQQRTAEYFEELRAQKERDEAKELANMTFEPKINKKRVAKPDPLTGVKGEHWLKERNELARRRKEEAEAKLRVKPSAVRRTNYVNNRGVESVVTKVEPFRELEVHEMQSELHRRRIEEEMMGELAVDERFSPNTNTRRFLDSGVFYETEETSPQLASPQRTRRLHLKPPPPGGEDGVAELDSSCSPVERVLIPTDSECKINEAVAAVEVSALLEEDEDDEEQEHRNISPVQY